jgi:hypothetical protein
MMPVAKRIAYEISNGFWTGYEKTYHPLPSLATAVFNNHLRQMKLKAQMSKHNFIADQDCTHEEYARERPIFGGQKSGDFQCLKCGFTWDPDDPPVSPKKES